MMSIPTYETLVIRTCLLICLTSFEGRRSLESRKSSTEEWRKSLGKKNTKSLRRIDLKKGTYIEKSPVPKMSKIPVAVESFKERSLQEVP
jgi:hypothetical protein